MHMMSDIGTGWPSESVCTLSARTVCSEMIKVQRGAAEQRISRHSSMCAERKHPRLAQQEHNDFATNVYR